MQPDDSTAADGRRGRFADHYMVAHAPYLVSSMNRRGPSRVVVYDIGSGRPIPVAEFTLSSTGSVSLELLGDVACPLAQQWFSEGIPSIRDGSIVRRDDGVEFMRALLQPFRMSYYRIVDIASGSDGA